MHQQQNGSHASNQTSKITYRLASLIDKFRMLVNLEIGNGKADSFKNNYNGAEECCIQDVNMQLMKQFIKIFQKLKQHDQQKHDENINQQIRHCQRIIKLLQMHIIETVQAVMKTDPVLNLPHNEDLVEGLYRQFYIICSEYMNKNYGHSNSLCLVLSQQVKSLTDSANLKFKEKSTNQIMKSSPSKLTQSADYYLLKQLLEKVTSAKRLYKQQHAAQQDQIVSLNSKIEELKTQITNLKNLRDQLIEDLSQLEQAIQNNTIETAREVLQKKNSLQKKQKLKQASVNDKIIQPSIKSQQLDGFPIKSAQIMNNSNKITQDSVLKSLREQIDKIKGENETIKKQNGELNHKLEKLKNQIHRAAWIISVQNREIGLYEQKVKSLQTNSFQQKSQSLVTYERSVQNFDSPQVAHVLVQPKRTIPILQVVGVANQNSQPKPLYLRTHTRTHSANPTNKILTY